MGLARKLKNFATAEGRDILSSGKKLKRTLKFTVTSKIKAASPQREVTERQKKSGSERQKKSDLRKKSKKLVSGARERSRKVGGLTLQQAKTLNRKSSKKVREQRQQIASHIKSQRRVKIAAFSKPPIAK
jgi:vacuolar-type H+-ATPase subunit H